jgi:hypothetical protein
MKATSLHLRVTEAAETHIDMTFCASLTEHLPRLLPSALRQKLVRRSIDPVRLAAGAVAGDFPPGELFCMADGPRTVRAWLE